MLIKKSHLSIIRRPKPRPVFVTFVIKNHQTLSFTGQHWINKYFSFFILRNKFHAVITPKKQEKLRILWQKRILVNFKCFKNCWQIFFLFLNLISFPGKTGSRFSSFFRIYAKKIFFPRTKKCFYERMKLFL